MSEVSTKPYLIRAIHAWCTDQGFTPYLAALVDEHVRIPPGTAREGQIVLDIGFEATHQLDLGNEMIQFQARFGGVAQWVRIPVANVLAVYAQENGHGMAFEPEPFDGESAPAPEPAPDATEPEAPADKPAAERSHLKVIK
ncbi:ClpXP protease specificity-enhancing factor [Denitromonas iodatirespirans]|uniref:ClpXP protease specificity-enhancing factor n=1 Tax=Denitromonas iodatirespirans TaxID=2795389 RepID=A0A944D614_DENI1|nr:ClpXP protease specificity-enhancing factor [Denitromonas iodatirespirans]MBT0960630.1 ClpXP protease specificity-enhancing factor [Denitromonas iodatirespirans]